MTTTPLSLIIRATLGTLFLTACGGSGDSDTPKPNNPPMNPPPATQDFPVQTAAPQMLTLSEDGTILAAENGLSLYFFAEDPQGASTCEGGAGAEQGYTDDLESCAATWPPLLVGDGATAAGNFTFVTRSDGSQQWSFKGYPLYTYSEDSVEGDTLGDGVDGTWDLARPMPVKESADSNPAFVANQRILTATSTGEVLETTRVDKEGFSLYLFDMDPLDESACYGLNGDDCITTWPPLLADNGAKFMQPLSVVELDNGLTQWTYRGKPLYLYSGDDAAGEMNGDGINDVWHLATPEPAIMRGAQDDEVLTATGRQVILVAGTDGTLESEPMDKDQFSLYTFDNDETETSNCGDSCIVNWPALLANSDDTAVGEFTIFTRDDGHMQWAYQGAPLYLFAGDEEAGDRNGDGIDGVWHLIEAPAETPTISTNLQVKENTLGETLTTSGQSHALMPDGDGGFTASVVERSGFQLYTFDDDAENASSCTSATCMQNWPALLADETDAATAPFSIFTRSDGHMQWAVNGQPLYYFAGDTEATQENGEGVGNVWWVARVAPVRVFTHESEGNMLIAHGHVLPSQGKTAAELTNLTLYTFDSDTPDSGESTCFGNCAVIWPPLYATSNDEAFGEFTIIPRTEDDNSETLQWVYKGLPLYFFEGDNSIGDTTGDYPGWTIARP